MPSQNHEILKLKAIEWLYQVKKCKIVAVELKFGNYIYDCCGTDFNRIYIIEAKRSYNDFKKDCNNPDDVKNTIAEYKKLLKENGDTSYIDLIKKEKEKSIKFYNKMIFSLANECYIIAPQDIIKKDELPKGWGLIDEYTCITAEAEKRAVDKKWIIKIIGEIAKKHTKMYLKSIGVNFIGKKVVFPETLLLSEDKEIEVENEPADTDS